MTEHNYQPWVAVMLSDEAKWKEYYNTKAAQKFWADFGAGALSLGSPA